LSGTLLRLLFNGLTSPDAGSESCAPFSPEELAKSPLRIPECKVWEQRKSGSITFMEQEEPQGRSAFPGPVYLAGVATSSLDIAHALIHADLLPEWGSVLVLSQTMGRGQLRRQWFSPAGNIYAALRLPRTSPFHTEAAAPALGGLMAEALHRTGHNVAMKWPNDIVREDKNERGSLWKKAGGILLEERGGALVAGIGLNLASVPDPEQLRPGALPAGLLAPPCRQGTTKNEAPPNLSVFTVWDALVEQLFFCYRFGLSGSKPFHWHSLAQKHLAFTGWRVRLDDAIPEQYFEQQPDNAPALFPEASSVDSMAVEKCADQETVEGIMDGLCLSGALRLITTAGTRTFWGGSLTPLRPGLRFSG